MKLHEYQAKDIFRKFGIPVPKGRVATSVEEALKAGQDLPGRHGSSKLRCMQEAEEKGEA